MIEHTIELIVVASNVTLRIVDKMEKRSISLSSQELLNGSNKYLQISGDEPIYVGGVPNSMRERISSAQLGHVKNASSLRGCMSMLSVNSRLLDLSQDLDYSHKISPGCGELKSACSILSYSNDPNDDRTTTAVAKLSPCLNGGRCVEKLTLAADFVCECANEFTGSLCETPVKLSGSGLQYRALALPLVADSSSNTR